MRLFAYKMSRDYGFAPNPFHDVCTLATCKPHIRGQASVGDLVVACGSAELGLPERVIAVMRVAGVLTFQQYWDDPRFAIKRPFFHGANARVYGDNIYHHADDGSWVQERSHHTYEDGRLNADNLRQDTSADAVLWAEDFVYWGRSAPLIPLGLRNFEGDDLYPAKVRDRRSRFAAAFIAEVDDWFRSTPDRNRKGRPINW